MVLAMHSRVRHVVYVPRASEIVGHNCFSCFYFGYNPHF